MTIYLVSDRSVKQNHGVTVVCVVRMLPVILGGKENDYSTQYVSYEC